jgi:hypothetical protein
MKYFIFIIAFFFSISLIAQNGLVEKHFSGVDSLYREDQFYLGLGVNFLLNRPQDMRQSGFSGGFHLGYIRDMPLNTRRNISIGVGIGLSVNTYTQNLFIGEDVSGQTIFDVIDSNVDFNENRFSTNVVEMPIHLRWRTSDIGDNNSFWRIYTGLNIGYLYYFKSVYRQGALTVEQTQFDELNRMRYAFYFAFGKSKINFFFKYSLNPLFDGLLQDTGQPLGVDEIKAGLVFYIL